MKQTFNFHTHTSRCGHAYGWDEQYVKAAIKAGFQKLGFSDHMGYPGYSMPKDRMDGDQVFEYLESIGKLKNQYQDQIQIYKGFEIEWYDSQKDYLIDMRKACDYMILGQHMKHPYGYGYDYLCDDEDVMMYATQIEAGMASGLVSYLAHPDYFMLGRRDFNESCVEASKKICEASLRYQVPLEINLKGLTKTPGYYEDGKVSAYPYRRFWEIASSYGCEAVYGFDAHSPADLLESGRIHRADEILEGISIHHLSELTLK